LILLCTLLVVPTGVASACTDSYIGPAEGSWATAANWSAGHPPTEADVACIGAGKSTKMTAAGVNAVAGLQGEGTLTIKESTLKIVGTSETWVISTLKLQYKGVLSGAGSLEVRKGLAWEQESTMSGAGLTILGPGTANTIGSGNTTFSLTGRPLVNEGTVTQAGLSKLNMVEGASFENLGVYNANGEKSSAQISSDATSSFANKGKFQRTAGSTVAQVSSNFANTGSVIAGTAAIKFNGGRAVSLEDPSQLEGTLSFEKATVAVGAIVSPKATFTLREAELSVPTGKVASVGSLAMSYEGNIAGAGTVEVTKGLSWESQSTMSGAGQTILRPSAVSTIGSANSNFTLSGRKLVNEGTITQLAYSTLREQAGGVFENLGTYNANGEKSFWQLTSEGVGSAFVNRGTFQKTEGTGTVHISANFENAGTLRLSPGLMRIEGVSNLLTLASGSTVEGKIICRNPAVVLESTSSPNATLQLREDPILVPGEQKAVIGRVELEYEANVTGSGSLEVVNGLAWEGLTTMSGKGKTVLRAGSVNNLKSGSNTVNLTERTLVNEGVFTQESNTRLQLSSKAAFKNEGIYNFESEPYTGPQQKMIYGESGTFVNKGVFQRTTAESDVIVTPDFENPGVIKAQSSNVKIEHPKRVPASEKFGKHACAGDPVDCATGNFTESQVDIAVGGRGLGIDLIRSYSAQAAATAASPGSFGYGWTGSFSDRLLVEGGGEAVTVIRTDGSTIPFTRTSGVSYSAPAWSQEALSGSPEAGYTFIATDQAHYRFSGSGRLEAITDRNGNETTLSYDSEGRLQTVIDPAGRQLAFTYNPGGQVEAVEDPMGRSVEYAYEGGNLVSVTLPGEPAPRWQFGYDASHRITSITDGRGGKTTNEYDSSSRVISQTDPAGRTLAFQYEGFHTTITNKATGAVTDEWFTSNNEPFSITHGYGTAVATTESFAYDEAGRLVRLTDGNGHTTTYGYDAAGNRIREKDPLGHETKWTYNGTHDLISTTTPGGEMTTIERDGSGNVESISRPAPGEETQTTTFAHDEHGQLESLTDPLGHTWTYGYDSYGNRTSETDPLGNEQTTAYDVDSRVTAITTPRGNLEGSEPAQYTTTIERDAQGRPLKVTDPLGHATEYAYDGNGNLASVTDAKGHTTKYAYNADDERTKVEKPGGATLQTAYDGAGYVSSQTDGNGKTTTYVRNVLEQPVEVIDPLGRKTLESFDAAGNLVGMVDPAERNTTYSYDTADRLTGIDYSEEATPDADFEYDADGNVVTISDGTGESTFEYDQLGRLTRSEDGHGEAVEYSYDLGEEQIGIVYPNGKSIARTFDEAGRLESVTDWLGGTTSFGYDADSSLTGIAFPVESGNVDEYAYDRASRMSAATFRQGSETLASLSYVRDALGQLEKEARSGLPGPEEVSYGYDQNNRLVEAGSAAFEYDAADNMTKGIGSTNAYDAASQLETGTGIAYSYDKLGERVKATPSVGPATSYGYDQAGNLVSISRPEEGEVPAIAETMTYDATGLLASKTSGLSTQYLSWDASTQLPLLLADEERSYVYGPNDLPIEQISATEEPTYLHHDQLGSTRLLTDPTGKASATFSYAPYGGLEAKTGTATTPLGFAGQYTDEATGLQYLRARFYDPRTAQFLSRDAMVALTQAPYTYVQGNPLNFVDPSGHMCTKPIVVGGIQVGEVPDILCSWQKGGEEILESPLTGPFAGIACVVNPECALVEGLLAAGALTTLSNLLRAEHDPCFNFWGSEIEGLLVLLAGAGPGGLLERFGGTMPGLGTTGKRALEIVEDVPGIILDVVHSVGRGH